MIVLFIFRNLKNTVLAVNNCVEHDDTSYVVLKCVEVEFWCGMCRCDTGTQCWVHRINVKAAHFGARMLKGKPPGEGAMPDRREICLFQGMNVDDIGWNFQGGIQTPWPTISTWIHSAGPPVLWASMQKPRVWVERLLRSMKQQKESNRMTLCQVNSLNIDPVYWTLCPSITSTRSTSKFDFNMLQYSVGGAVMLDVITYGQDCVSCVLFQRVQLPVSSLVGSLTFNVSTWILKRSSLPQLLSVKAEMSQTFSLKATRSEDVSNTVFRTRLKMWAGHFTWSSLVSLIAFDVLLAESKVNATTFFSRPML